MVRGCLHLARHSRCLRQQWASPELGKVVTFFAYHEPPGLRGFGQSLQETDSPA